MHVQFFCPITNDLLRTHIYSLNFIVQLYQYCEPVCVILTVKDIFVAQRIRSTCELHCIQSNPALIDINPSLYITALFWTFLETLLPSYALLVLPECFIHEWNLVKVKKKDCKHLYYSYTVALTV